MKQILGFLLILASLAVNSQVPFNYFGNQIQGPVESSILGSGVPTAWPNWNPNTLRTFNYAYSSVQGSYKQFHWRDINTAQGVYDWSVFDVIMNKYKAKGVTDVIFVFYRTPAWAGGGTQGYAPPSSMAYVTTFITAVANRAKSLGLEIKYWEVWNEPNNGPNGSWSGTINQMITLCQTVYNAVKAFNPAYKVISPACQGYGAGGVTTDTLRYDANTAFSGGTIGPRWCNTFFANGGGSYCDIMGFHGYMGNPLSGPHRSPEAIDTLVNAYTKIATAHGQTAKELWNTESMNLAEGKNQTEQARFLAVTYLIEWTKGVDRKLYYSWDAGDGQQWYYNTGIDSVGRANQSIINWMLGANVTNLVKAGNVYTVSVIKGGYTYLAVWNKSGNSTYTTSYTRQTTLFGGTSTVSGSLTIGTMPVLLYNECL